MTRFRGPPYYKARTSFYDLQFCQDPKFHISLLWCLGDLKRDLTPTKLRLFLVRRLTFIISRYRTKYPVQSGRSASVLDLTWKRLSVKLGIRYLIFPLNNKAIGSNLFLMSVYSSVLQLTRGAALKPMEKNLRSGIEIEVPCMMMVGLVCFCCFKHHPLNYTGFGCYRAVYLLSSPTLIFSAMINVFPAPSVYTVTSCTIEFNRVCE